MKVTSQIPSSTSLMPSRCPARTVETLIFFRCKQIRPQAVDEDVAVVEGVFEDGEAPIVLGAIDISKLRNDALIEGAGDRSPKRVIVVTSRAEHDRFVELLASLGRPVITGFEATGN
jgi:hypothetical protein